MVKEIALSNSGMVATIDDDDLVLVKGMAWRVFRDHGVPRYAVCKIGGVSCLMHRVIMGFSKGDPDVDHLNGDGFDNRRSNLRVSNKSRNACNTSMHRDNLTGYKGVTQLKRARNPRWGARIMIDGHDHRLGCFDSPIEAARAYDKAALELHGEFANINGV